MKPTVATTDGVVDRSTAQEKYRQQFRADLPADAAVLMSVARQQCRSGS